jgi:hypothetical protein
MEGGGGVGKRGTNRWACTSGAVGRYGGGGWGEGWGGGDLLQGLQELRRQRQHAAAGKNQSLYTWLT